MRSSYGLLGYDVTIAVVVRKTIFVSCNDEDGAIEEAINGFTITDKDWKMEDLEVEDVQPDYFDN
jgi:hypothetical protein